MADITAAMALDSGYDTPAKVFALYRIGCLVNEHHDWRFWMDPTSLAAQVRVSPGTMRNMLAEFVRDGWLDRIEEGGGRGRHSVYQWARWSTPKISTGATVSGRKPRVGMTVSGETARGDAETARGSDSRLSIDEQHERLGPPQADSNVVVDAERADLESRIPETAREPALAAIREARDNLHRRP